MTKPCVVPKCKTGYKSYKTKRSVFRAPKNIELLKKWEAAIPGKLKLRATHVVCDKHFEDKHILREWIKHDSNGQIIARAPYKYPQLSKLAVPSKFVENTEDERAVDSINGYLNAPIPASPINTSVDSVGPSFVAHSAFPSSIEGSETKNTGLSASINGELLSQIKVEDVDLVQSSAECVATFIEESPDAEEISPTIVANDKKFLPTEGVDTDSTPSRTNNNPCSVSSTVTISQQIHKENASTSSCRSFSAVIPSSWSVGELRVEKGQRIVFSYAITKIKNGVHVPVVQRCLALDADRKLEYFVYGRLVETRGTILEQTLKDAASLPNTLQAFQWMGICNGIGVNDNNVPMEHAFLDYVQQWRHNNCTLISKRKRCEYCVKLRNRVINIKNRPTLKRIRRNASTPFD